MKKLLIALAVVVALAIAASFLFAGKIDELIADTIQTEGTAALGTQVSVTSVETKLTEGVATINGLSIANPPGYEAANAVQIDSFSADVDYGSQVVENILIEKPVINAELVGTRSNFQDLMDNIPEAAEEEVADGEAEEAAEDSEITIKSLQLRQATVNLNSDKLGKTSFVMDDFVLNDVTGTADQVSEAITASLIAHLTQQITGFATAQITEMVKAAAIEEAKEAVNEKINEKLAEGLLDEKSGELGEKLKGLKLKIN
ncbi:MAG: hypothetical protein AAF431_07705 [Pseudomonadota bacterium]